MKGRGRGVWGGRLSVIGGYEGVARRGTVRGCGTHPVARRLVVAGQRLLRRPADVQRVRHRIDLYGIDAILLIGDSLYAQGDLNGSEPTPARYGQSVMPRAPVEGWGSERRRRGRRAVAVSVGTASGVRRAPPPPRSRPR